MLVVLNTLLRALAVALAALSLTWGIASGEGLIAAMGGAALGVITGQILGGTRVRLLVVLATLAALCLGTWALGSWSMTSEDVPRAIGPGMTLQVAYAARFAVLAFGAAAISRAMAIRVPTAAVAELVGIAAASTVVFSAHREGVIERPLWLSDWAWEQGVSPATVLYAVGLGAVAMLTFIHLLERKGGRPVSTMASLVGFGILASWWFTYHPASPPKPISDVPPVASASGDPPRPPTPDAGDDARPNPENFLDGGVIPDGGGSPDSGDGGDDAGDAGDAGDGGDGGDAGDAGDGGGSPDASDAGDGGGQSPDAADGGSSSGDAGEDAMPSSAGDASDDGPPPPPGDSDGGDPHPSQGPQIMAVVILDDDYTPPGQAYFFRQEAQSHFTGSRMAPTPRGDADLDVPLSFPTEPTMVVEPPTLKGRAKVRGLVAMISEHTNPLALEGTVELSPAPNPNNRRFVRAYRFESRSQTASYRGFFGKKMGNPAWSDDLRKYYLEAPTDPRYQKVIEQILAAIPPAQRADPFSRALAAKLWLDHAISYSRQDRHANTPDPVADMLFGNRIGYCVHLSHAAVYLWRLLGVPSRVASGYRVEEETRRGGSTLLLRAGDSHAWPEMYIDGYGWIILDIAPEKNLDPLEQMPDEELQQRLGEMARAKPDPTPKPIDKLALRSRDLAKRTFFGLIYFVVSTLASLYLLKIWRWLRPWTAGRKSIARVGYREAIDRLSEVGLSRDYGETREHFAARVAQRAPAFEQVTELHLAAYFRDPSLDPEKRDELSQQHWRQILGAFHDQLSRLAPWWRRVLGVLNPVWFLGSR